jgi:hypothetical protein
METLAFSRLLAIPSSILSILEKEDFLHVVHICPQSNKTSVKTFFHQTDAKVWIYYLKYDILYLVLLIDHVLLYVYYYNRKQKFFLQKSN